MAVTIWDARRMWRLVWLVAAALMMRLSSVEGGDFDWDFEPVDGYPLIAFSRYDDDAEVAFLFNYTGTLNPPHKYFAATLFQADCETPADHTAVNAIMVPRDENSTIAAADNTFQVDVDIIQETISDSVHYESSEDGVTGWITFCLRVDYFHSDGMNEPVSMNWRQQAVEITVDLQANATLDIGFLFDYTGTTIEVGANLDFPVVAYFCDENNKEIWPGRIRQGSHFEVCVEVDDSSVRNLLEGDDNGDGGVYVKDVHEFRVSQPGNWRKPKPTKAVDEGDVDDLTVKECNTRKDGRCKVKHQIKSEFFTNPNPEDLVLDGTALLVIGNYKTAGVVEDSPFRQRERTLSVPFKGRTSSVEAAYHEKRRLQQQKGNGDVLGKNPFNLKIGLLPNEEVRSHHGEGSGQVPVANGNNTYNYVLANESAILAVLILIAILLAVIAGIQCVNCCRACFRAGGRKQKSSDDEEEERARQLMSASVRPLLSHRLESTMAFSAPVVKPSSSSPPSCKIPATGRDDDDAITATTTSLFNGSCSSFSFENGAKELGKVTEDSSRSNINKNIDNKNPPSERSVARSRSHDLAAMKDASRSRSTSMDSSRGLSRSRSGDAMDNKNPPSERSVARSRSHDLSAMTKGAPLSRSNSMDSSRGLSRSRSGEASSRASSIISSSSSCAPESRGVSRSRSRDVVLSRSSSRGSILTRSSSRGSIVSSNESRGNASTPADNSTYSTPSVALSEPRRGVAPTRSLDSHMRSMRDTAVGTTLQSSATKSGSLQRQRSSSLDRRNGTDTDQQQPPPLNEFDAIFGIKGNNTDLHAPRRSRRPMTADIQEIV